MKRRDLLASAMAIGFVSWGGQAYPSMCIETGGGGALTSGTLSRGQFESLLEELRKAPSDASLFVVQKDEGYYAKVCNTKEQIKHFEGKYHPRKWKDGKKMMKDDIYKMIPKQGVIRINVTQEGLMVYI